MAMEFSGEYRIPATQQQVWDALNDPGVLQACIVGCTQLEKVSDTEFMATVVAKVGPISATFKGQVVLSDLNAPNSYTMTGQGRGGAAGFAKMGAQVLLSQEAGLTVLKYVAQAEIGGKLASVGSRLVQIVAKKNADDFFAVFSRHVGGTGWVETVTPSAVELELELERAKAAEGQSSTQTPASGMLSSLGALVPAWLVVFACGVGVALGYFAAHGR